MIEPSKILDAYKPTCRAIRSLFPGKIEVVLHNLITNKIVHIENAFSKRKVGDDSLLATENYQHELNTDGLIGPYKKSNPDGSKLKSISSLITDDKGEPIGLLCINMKVDGVERALNQLQALITIDESIETKILKNDWRELSNSIIAEILLNRNLQLAQAKRIDKLAIVEGLYAADVFSARGSAEYIAEALGISRANLYVLLQEVRKASAKEEKINLK